MKLPRRTFLHLAAAAGALPPMSRFARAQTYPARPITMVIGYASDDPEHGPVARSRPVRKWSPPPFQTLDQIGNVITELPAELAVVPPINGSVWAVGREVL
jgi:hypothetical protein